MGNYTKKQIQDLNNLLGDILCAKENLCRYVKDNNLGCRKCPLNEEDKCGELNLPEFDFKNGHWKYEELGDD